MSLFSKQLLVAGAIALLSSLCPSVSHAQNIYTFAGNGTAGFSGDGGPATAAQLNEPSGIVADYSGNIYISDYQNNRIRKVDASGVITTIAGTGTPGFGGDGGQATAAQLQKPAGICLDGSGNLIFADNGNNRIRKITMSTGIITTIAGNGGVGFTGDGGQATAAQLGFPKAVTIDNAGNIFIPDQNNFRIRKVNTSGIISTIAGTGAGCCVTTDGNLASASVIGGPIGVCLDGGGNLYVADRGSNRVRQLNASTNRIYTLAGSATFGFTGDGGPGTAAKVYYPVGVVLDPAGNIYFTDELNFRVRKINTSGTISTFAGSGAGTASGGSGGFSGDGGPATAAQLKNPSALTFQVGGNIYVCDNQNNRVRLIGTPRSSLHNPYFINGRSQLYNNCINATRISIDTALAITDVDTGQTVTWSIILAPAHGSASVAYSTTTTGGTRYPSGLYYTPTSGYTGLDSFKVRSFDGSLADTTTIIFNILPRPFAGVINGRDSVCVSRTDTLTDTAAGGVWYSHNPTIGTISAAGIVTGLAVGYDTIYYVVSNICGVDSARFIVKVRTGAGCTGGVAAAGIQSRQAFEVYPNPNTGTFTFSLYTDAEETATLTLTNLVGQTVYTTQVSTNRPQELNLSLPPGTYLITAQTPNNRYKAQLITLY